MGCEVRADWSIQTIFRETPDQESGKWQNLQYEVGDLRCRRMTAAGQVRRSSGTAFF
jgi:hypothetical protein